MAHVEDSAATFKLGDISPLSGDGEAEIGDVRNVFQSTDKSFVKKEISRINRRGLSLFTSPPHIISPDTTESFLPQRVDANRAESEFKKQPPSLFDEYSREKQNLIDKKLENLGQWGHRGPKSSLPMPSNSPRPRPSAAIKDRRRKMSIFPSPIYPWKSPTNNHRLSMECFQDSPTPATSSQPRRSVPHPSATFRSLNPMPHDGVALGLGRAERIASRVRRRSQGSEDTPKEEFKPRLLAEPIPPFQPNQEPYIPPAVSNSGRTPPRPIVNRKPASQESEGSTRPEPQKWLRQRFPSPPPPVTLTPPLPSSSSSDDRTPNVPLKFDEEQTPSVTPPDNVVQGYNPIPIANAQCTVPVIQAVYPHVPLVQAYVRDPVYGMPVQDPLGHPLGHQYSHAPVAQSQPTIVGRRLFDDDKPQANVSPDGSLLFSHRPMQSDLRTPQFGNRSPSPERTPQPMNYNHSKLYNSPRPEKVYVNSAPSYADPFATMAAHPSPNLGNHAVRTQQGDIEAEYVAIGKCVDPPTVIPVRATSVKEGPTGHAAQNRIDSLATDYNTPEDSKRISDGGLSFATCETAATRSLLKEAAKPPESTESMEDGSTSRVQVDAPDDSLSSSSIKGRKFDDSSPLRSRNLDQKLNSHDKLFDEKALEASQAARNKADRIESEVSSVIESTEGSALDESDFDDDSFITESTGDNTATPDSIRLASSDGDAKRSVCHALVGPDKARSLDKKEAEAIADASLQPQILVNGMPPLAGGQGTQGGIQLGTMAIQGGNSSETAAMQNGSMRENAAIQGGYSSETAAIQNGSTRETAAIQNGSMRENAGVQADETSRQGSTLLVDTQVVVEKRDEGGNNTLGDGKKPDDDAPMKPTQFDSSTDQNETLEKEANSNELVCTATLAPHVYKASALVPPIRKKRASSYYIAGRSHDSLVRIAIPPYLPLQVKPLCWSRGEYYGGRRADGSFTYAVLRCVNGEASLHQILMRPKRSWDDDNISSMSFSPTMAARWQELMTPSVESTKLPRQVRVARDADPPPDKSNQEEIVDDNFCPPPRMIPQKRGARKDALSDKNSESSIENRPARGEGQKKGERRRSPEPKGKRRESPDPEEMRLVEVPKAKNSGGKKKIDEPREDSPEPQPTAKKRGRKKKIDEPREDSPKPQPKAKNSGKKKIDEPREDSPKPQPKAKNSGKKKIDEPIEPPEPQPKAKNSGGKKKISEPNELPQTKNKEKGGTSLEAKRGRIFESPEPKRKKPDTLPITVEKIGLEDPARKKRRVSSPEIQTEAATEREIIDMFFAKLRERTTRPEPKKKPGRKKGSIRNVRIETKPKATSASLVKPVAEQRQVAAKDYYAHHEIFVDDNDLKELPLMQSDALLRVLEGKCMVAFPHGVMTPVSKDTTIHLPPKAKPYHLLCPEGSVRVLLVTKN